jgi:hypothetical protein
VAGKLNFDPSGFSIIASVDLPTTIRMHIFFKAALLSIAFDP